MEPTLTGPAAELSTSGRLISGAIVATAASLWLLLPNGRERAANRWLGCLLGTAALVAGACAPPAGGGGGGGGTNQAPTARITATYVDTTPLIVSFDGTGSTDSDGFVLSYAWNYGDGSPVEFGPTVTHQFAAGNAYTVTLTVTDNAGGTSVATVGISATAPPP